MPLSSLKQVLTFSSLEKEPSWPWQLQQHQLWRTGTHNQPTKKKKLRSAYPCIYKLAQLTISLQMEAQDQEMNYLKAHVQALYANLANRRDSDSSPVYEPVSRPSSRNSTTSSTPSLAYSQYNNSSSGSGSGPGAFSSLASHSTRSSVSLEDLDFVKVRIEKKKKKIFRNTFFSHTCPSC